MKRRVYPRGYAAHVGVTHRDVDSRQLEMGIEIEGEHTSNHYRARRIALDHLAEFPDYYSRLMKMEEAAKKYWSKRKTSRIR